MHRATSPRFPVMARNMALKRLDALRPNFVRSARSFSLTSSLSVEYTES